MQLMASAIQRCFGLPNLDFGCHAEGLAKGGLFRSHVSDDVVAKLAAFDFGCAFH
jgi:hypothetical protein